MGDDVFARRNYNQYIFGVVSKTSQDTIEVWFDFDEGTISYPAQDKSAVIKDEESDKFHVGEHVMATWEYGGFDIYHIGYVIGEGPVDPVDPVSK